MLTECRKKCRKCGKSLPNRIKVEGIWKNISNRKYCLECSPWGLHNTRNMEKKEKKEKKNLSGLQTCCVCREEKSLNDFYRRTDRDCQTSMCRNCLNQKAVLWADQRKEKFINLFGGKCQICGYNKAKRGLHFHHLDPSKKENDYGNVKYKSDKLMGKYVEGCMLVCANCHSEIHEKEDEAKKDFYREKFKKYAEEKQKRKNIKKQEKE